MKNIYIIISLFCSLTLSAQQLKLADQAYEVWNYQSAAEQYERIIFLMPKEATKLKPVQLDSIKFRLADCYWQMRVYEPAAYWYAQVPEVMKQDIEIRRRLAELKAMNGAYTEASETLQGLNRWQKKAKGFSRTAFMSRDSADWHVNYIQLDEKNYREFSPMLLDGKVYWTSNERKTELIPKVLGWDGYRYTHILSSPDTFQALPSSPNRPLWDSAVYRKSIQKNQLAKQFVHADNAHLKTVSGLSANKLAKKKGFSALSLEGTTDLKYNVGHTSFSSKTEKIYMNVNKPFRGKDRSRLIGIVEADWNNGIVKNIRNLSLVDSGYMALHPAIHPNGDLLVFSSDLPGGKGGYDLYVSRMQDDGKWSQPMAWTELNSAGNEVFARFTPKGDLVFSSDGYAGYGGLDLYMIKILSGKIMETIHLPYPVNSRYDDFGWTETADGNRGYFSSDRLGDDDIFQFTHSPNFSIINGRVLTRADGSAQSGAMVQLMEEDEDGNWNPVGQKNTNQNGDYSFRVKPNHRYQIKVQYEGIAEPELTTQVSLGENKYLGEILSGKEKEIIVQKEPELTPEEKALQEEIANTPIRDDDREKGSIYKGELSQWIHSSEKVFIVHHYFDKVQVIKKDQKIMDEVKQFLSDHLDYTLYIVSATDCLASTEYNDVLSYRRSVHLQKIFSSTIDAVIKPYWVSERNLLIPCDEQEKRLSRQVENRYSYLILRKQPIK